MITQGEYLRLARMGAQRIIDEDPRFIAVREAVETYYESHPEIGEAHGREDFALLSQPVKDGLEALLVKQYRVRTEILRELLDREGMQ